MSPKRFLRGEPRRFDQPVWRPLEVFLDSDELCGHFMWWMGSSSRMVTREVFDGWQNIQPSDFERAALEQLLDRLSDGDDRMS